MPVPRQRHTKSKRNQQRAHQAFKALGLANCTKCGQPVLPHIACKNCGTYQGREVIDVMKKLTKREQKKRQKELKAQEAEAREHEGHEHK
ncbi:50S ribosomal protein L32 [Patescibacteria group bacterium]|nr:50S ribosomal protein L32 [Patescibacteria group bacterium]MBU4142462.1 50S ribosomal protein L32 [Patescibacteria group bacterium]